MEDYQDVKDSSGSLEKSFLANGEIGRVLAVAPKLTIARFADEGSVIIKIPMGSMRAEEASEEGEDRGTGCDFGLAYAITGHKSQGSEWPVIIAMIDPAAGQVASREYWYTVISRAKKWCLLLGRGSVMRQQCKRVSLTKRKTFLKELLKSE